FKISGYTNKLAMKFTALIVQLILLAIGTYLYLLSIGALKFKNPNQQEKVNQFRKENSWLRILALALMAIMFFNVVLTVMEMV
ncbi:MAG: hypothetical protein AAF242_18915, partial [Bacteroidota bacterium]